MSPPYDGFGAPISNPVWDGEGCEECGNDDGPHHHRGRWLCLDCLEAEPAIDPAQVDPIHLPRLGGLL